MSTCPCRPYLPSDVCRLGAQYRLPCEPVDDAHQRHDCHGEHPEPDKDEDLLVKQVDRQHTLNREPVDVRLLTDLQRVFKVSGYRSFTECDAVHVVDDCDVDDNADAHC